MPEQGSEAWHMLRYGHPTASKAKELIQSTGKPSTSMKGYAEILAAERFAGKPLDSFEGNSATQRGNELEPHARSWYSFEVDRDVNECGFFMDSTERFGASPDGLVGDDGLIEIKCQEAKGHVKTAVLYNKTKKTPTAYIQQIQMQLLVTERAWADLVLYHPELPCSIIRVERDDELLAALSDQIDACIEHRDSVLSILKGMAA